MTKAYIDTVIKTIQELPKPWHYKSSAVAREQQEEPSRNKFALHTGAEEEEEEEATAHHHLKEDRKHQLEYQ